MFEMQNKSVRVEERECGEHICRRVRERERVISIYPSLHPSPVTRVKLPVATSLDKRIVLGWGAPGEKFANFANSGEGASKIGGSHVTGGLQTSFCLSRLSQSVTPNYSSPLTGG